MDADHVLNEKQAAGLLCCSRALLRKWRAASAGPPWVRLGGRLVRYRRADLDAFVAANRVTPGEGSRDERIVGGVAERARVGNRRGQ